MTALVLEALGREVAATAGALAPLVLLLLLGEVDRARPRDLQSACHPEGAQIARGVERLEERAWDVYDHSEIDLDRRRGQFTESSLCRSPLDALLATQPTGQSPLVP